MNKKFIFVLIIALTIFKLPILAEAEVFNFPGPVVVEENPLSIFSTTYAGWRHAAELNGLRSQPGDPYNPLDAGYLLFLINAWGYQGEEFTNSASISFQATEDFSTEGIGTCIRFETTENGDVFHYERMRIDHNGNVGIGTQTPQSALQVDGYVQLDLTGGFQPPDADCDEPEEYGRMMVDEINEDMYICVVSGWKTLKGKK